MLGKGEGHCADFPCFEVSTFEKAKKMDARWIAACGLETRLDGIGGVVFGGDQDDAALEAGCAIGHGSACGDTSGKVEGEQGFAKAGVAVKDGQFAARDALFPEPTELHRFDVGKPGTVSV